MTTDDLANFNGAPKKPRFGNRMLRENSKALQLAILLLQNGFDFKAVSIALNNEFGVDESGSHIQIDRQIFQELSNKGRELVGQSASPGESCLKQIFKDYGSIGLIDKSVEEIFTKYDAMGKHFAKQGSLDEQNSKWLLNEEAKVAAVILWQSRFWSEISKSARKIATIKVMLQEVYGIKLSDNDKVGVAALRSIFIDKEGTEKREKIFKEVEQAPEELKVRAERTIAEILARVGDRKKEQGKRAAKEKWDLDESKIRIIGTPVHEYIEGTSKRWFRNASSLALVLYMLSKRQNGKRVEDGSAPNIAKAVLHFFGFPIDEESIKNQIRHYKKNGKNDKSDAENYIEAMSGQVTSVDMENAEKDFEIWKKR